MNWIPRVWWGWFIVPLIWPIWAISFVLGLLIVTLDHAFGDPEEAKRLLRALIRKDQP